MEAKLVKALLEFLQKGRPLVLATVVSQTGSSPRTAGSRMIIVPGQDVRGTIGGGRLEADVILAAGRDVCGRWVKLLDFNLAGDPTVDAMDMICGGKMQVMLEPVAADREQIWLWSNLAKAIEDRSKAVLVTVYNDSADRPYFLGRCLVLENRLVAGPQDYSGPVCALAGRLRKTRGPVIVKQDGFSMVAERVFPAGEVYIFGAGHVSRYLARLATMVGFSTIILDDRSQYACRDRFPEADRILVLESFENAFKGLAMDKDSYVVIVTRGHAHDKTVLAQALAACPGYIGMIGSIRKRDAIYKALLNEGFSKERLLQVACPIGLEIGAETPEEIAVSIVGQLVQARAGGF